MHVRLTAIIATILTMKLCCAVFAQDNAQHILVMSPEKLMEVLKNPQATVFDKAKACQRLALVGTKEAVPALAALLSEETLNAYARCGLESIQDLSVDVALREAAGKLHGRQLVGVLESIGRRRDVLAISYLNRLLDNNDATIATAAARALGAIGTVQASKHLTEALNKDLHGKTAVAEACLVCADRLIASAENSQALAIYQLVSKSKVPKHLRLAALAGQFRLQQTKALELLLTQFHSPDEDDFELGLAVARQLEGKDVSEVLAIELADMSPPRQALLLMALADRIDNVPLSAVLTAVKSPSEAVRAAAIEVLAKQGDHSTAEILIEAALEDSFVADLARRRLQTLQGDTINDAIAIRLKEADSKSKVVLLELTGARRILTAKPIVVSLLADSDETIRCAALTAFGQLADLNELEILLNYALAETKSAESETAQAALEATVQRTTNRDDCAARLAARLDSAPSLSKSYLLKLLGQISGPTALNCVTSASKSTDLKVKDAATKELGQWPNSEAAPSLLDIAVNDSDPKYRIRALRGYIRIARQLQLPDNERIEFFRKAMQISQRDEEKQLALGILPRISSAVTLELAVSYLQYPALKEASADAAIRIAGKLVASDPKAVAIAMQQVINSGVVDDRAQQLLAGAQAGSK